MKDVMQLESERVNDVIQIECEGVKRCDAVKVQEG